MSKEFLKVVARGLAYAVVFPSAALTGFGRWMAPFAVFAHGYAMSPGIIGDYLRAAYYRLTLEEFAGSSRISFGSFFSTAEARVEAGVYIGSYCILGKVNIGQRTQIASCVQILSGAHQHSRDGTGQISGSESGVFSRITIGQDCWIGAAAVVMADLGFGTTIGAGSVVTRPVPAQVVAVGSPARVVREAGASTQ